METRAAVVLLTFCAIVHGQTATGTAAFPRMPVLKKGFASWEATKVVAAIQIDWPDGSTSRLPGGDEGGNAIIEPTMVDGLFRRAVRACECRGHLDDASEFVMSLPVEPVMLKRTGFRWHVTAVAIRCPTIITRWNGVEWVGDVEMPDCITDPIGLGLRIRVARPVTGTAIFVKK